MSGKPSTRPPPAVATCDRASALSRPWAWRMAVHIAVAMINGAARPATSRSPANSAEPKVAQPTGQKSPSVSKAPSQVRSRPKARTAAILAGRAASSAAAIARTPEVPRPQPANVATFPLKPPQTPSRPTPAGPATHAMTFARRNPAARVATEAPPMRALERRMRAKAIGYFKASIPRAFSQRCGASTERKARWAESWYFAGRISRKPAPWSARSRDG